MLKRMAGVPVFGGLLILSILIIHNPGYIEGSRGQWGKWGQWGKEIVKGGKKWVERKVLERKEVSPKAAYGFLTLNGTYNKYESPHNETRVGVWMEPTFVIEIDSLARKMSLVIKLEVTWQDQRVWWKKDDITNPGDNFTFDTSILQ